ncbi:MAG: NrfD/PsrC family molybdoenzyme membrane anchor subunit, partial [Acidobacteriota bacterium]
MSTGHGDTVLVPFGWPVVLYLTLAGLSAGAALISCWLLWSDTRRWWDLARRGLLVAATGIALGGFGLVADLEAPGRFWMILAHFNPASWIAWGARIITLFGLWTAFAWVLLRREATTEGPMSSTLRVTTSGVALLALAIGLYPAWVLMQAVARPLWDSPWIAPLFLLSALHAGLAVLLLVQTKAGADQPKILGSAGLERALVGGQVVCLALYAATLAGAYAPALERLWRGDLAPWLWIGVVLLGWLVPLATTAGGAGSGRLLLR